jgi:hypothetical protein
VLVQRSDLYVHPPAICSSPPSSSPSLSSRALLVLQTTTTTPKPKYGPPFVRYWTNTKNSKPMVIAASLPVVSAPATPRRPVPSYAQVALARTRRPLPIRRSSSCASQSARVKRLVTNEGLEIVGCLDHERGASGVKDKPSGLEAFLSPRFFNGSRILQSHRRSILLAVLLMNSFGGVDEAPKLDSRCTAVRSHFQFC